MPGLIIQPLPLRRLLEAFEPDMRNGIVALVVRVRAVSQILDRNNLMAVYHEDMLAFLRSFLDDLRDGGIKFLDILVDLLVRVWRQRRDQDCRFGQVLKDQVYELAEALRRGLDGLGIRRFHVVRPDEDQDHVGLIFWQYFLGNVSNGADFEAGVPFAGVVFAGAGMLRSNHVDYVAGFSKEFVELAAVAIAITGFGAVGDRCAKGHDSKSPSGEPVCGWDTYERKRKQRDWKIHVESESTEVSRASQ